MLYANKTMKSQTRTFDFGSIEQITLGEQGRGRKLLALSCPEQMTIPACSLVKEYTIGTTRSGRPRIVKAGRNDYDLYMLLDSYGAYSRRGCGYVFVLSSQKKDFVCMGRGNGADGDAGRIGEWDCPLVKCPTDGIIRVRPSGGGYGIPSELYIIKNNVPHRCELKDIEDVCDALGINLAEEYPDFTMRNEDGHLKYNDSDWTVVLGPDGKW